MNDNIKQKREQLKAISTPFKLLIKEGAIGSINEGLANYYAEMGHTTLKSLKKWNEEGFKVKRGSQALLMWAEPKPINKKNEVIKNETNKEDEELFFPLAYLFSNLQVEPKTNAYLSK